MKNLVLETIDEFMTRRANEDINNFNNGYNQAMLDVLEMIEEDASYEELYESIDEYLEEGKLKTLGTVIGGLLILGDIGYKVFDWRMKKRDKQHSEMAVNYLKNKEFLKNNIHKIKQINYNTIEMKHVFGGGSSRFIYVPQKNAYFLIDNKEIHYEEALKYDGKNFYI